MDKHYPAYALFRWVDTGCNLRHLRPVSISTHKARLFNNFFPATVRLGRHRTLRKAKSTIFHVF